MRKGPPRGHLRKQHPQLGPSEVGAHAHVHAPPERKMSMRLAVDAELVWVDKDFRIAIGRCVQEHRLRLEFSDYS